MITGGTGGGGAVVVGGAESDFKIGQCAFVAW